jgi:hypothetical protein
MQLPINTSLLLRSRLFGNDMPTYYQRMLYDNMAMLTPLW